MKVSTGNNFGAGHIEFKEYLSDNMIILNGRFSFDYTKEEYLNADVLEIYVPELPMKRSLDTAVFLTYENTYGRMGTIVKSWIKNKTTICLEVSTAAVSSGLCVLIFRWANGTLSRWKVRWICTWISYLGISVRSMRGLLFVRNGLICALSSSAFIRLNQTRLLPLISSIFRPISSAKCHM